MKTPPLPTKKSQINPLTNIGGYCPLCFKAIKDSKSHLHPELQEMKSPLPTWKERLEKLINESSTWNINEANIYLSEFISSELERTRREMRKEMEKIQGLKLSTRGECDHLVLVPKSCGCCKEVFAYNKAIDDVLHILSKLK